MTPGKTPPERPLSLRQELRLQRTAWQAICGLFKETCAELLQILCPFRKNRLCIAPQL